MKKIHISNRERASLKKTKHHKMRNLETYVPTFIFFKKLLFYTVKSVIMSSFCHLYLHTVISFSVIVICFLENKEVKYYTVDVIGILESNEKKKKKS